VVSSGRTGGGNDGCWHIVGAMTLYANIWASDDCQFGIVWVGYRFQSMLRRLLLNDALGPAVLPCLLGGRLGRPGTLWIFYFHLAHNVLPGIELSIENMAPPPRHRGLTLKTASTFTSRFELVS
jgi:hypothetical protein